ncbi:MAG: hypothetical protein KF761_00860 [Salinibacterium sp.]|nr:hypothetical protein [Salinibacterium sp.]
MIEVAVIGDGQLARGVAAQLAERSDLRVVGPTPRDGIAAALDAGTRVVVIATTTRLADIAHHIEAAVLAGSNVIVSAEECAYPWAVDRVVADRLDTLARERGVTILGCGLNPGFVFDALVLTLLGTGGLPTGISVERTVDLSGFGPTVRGRLGLGVSSTDFAAGIESARILGHAGFPQSMSIVADALNVEIDNITTHIEPTLVDDNTVGFIQEYVAIVGGLPWFRARFIGHLSPAAAGLVVRDTIEITSRDTPLTCTIEPGIGSQSGSQSLIANSIDRVVAAPSGWLTVAELEPAHPRFISEHPARTSIS